MHWYFVLWLPLTNKKQTQNLFKQRERSDTADCTGYLLVGQRWHMLLCLFYVHIHFLALIYLHANPWVMRSPLTDD